MNALKRQSRTLLVGAVMTVSSLALFSTANAGTWTTLTPVPAALIGVEGASVAKIGKDIIVTNGFDGGDTATTRIYNIPSDTWSFGAVAPGASSEGAGVSHGGLFYQIGGRGPGFNANWTYNPTLDSWDATLTPLPTGRNGLAAAVAGNAIYAIGGRTSGGGPCTGFVLSTVERYDIDTDTWTTVAPLLSARSDAAAATVGGKIYLFGGCDVLGNILNTVDVYDPVTNSWSAAPTGMPTARASMYAVATKGNEVFVIGGFNPGINFGGLDTNEAYKVSTDTWRNTGDPMPTLRAEAGAVGHGGRIYIVGGGQPGFGNSIDANEVYKP